MVKKAKQLFQEKDESWSYSKTFALVASLLFCVKMSGLNTLLGLPMPSEPSLWLFFLGTVGGYRWAMKMAEKGS